MATRLCWYIGVRFIALALWIQPESNGLPWGWAVEATKLVLQGKAKR